MIGAAPAHRLRGVPAGELTLFLAGDVMTGRGIDQVLPHASDPVLFEPYVKDARGYVELAERENGPIPAPVGFEYVWGEALAELERVALDARIVNLETAVTTSGDAWPGKGIHYRMHPANGPVLAAAGIDACGLANNHVLDWGRAGLEETLRTLREAGIRTAGAGRDAAEAGAPAVVEIGANRGGEGGGPGPRRVVVFALGFPASGIPSGWAAGPERPGVNLLAELSARSAREVAAEIRRQRRSGDVVVVSVHWGGNWGWSVPEEQRRFARALIDAGGADVVHGHSSHHPKGVEVHAERPILYGCGDFVNDYEGIRSRESAEFRDHLVLGWFLTLRASGALARMEMAPFRLRRFRLERASPEDARWLAETLDRESRPFGTRVRVGEGGRLEASSR